MTRKMRGTLRDVAKHFPTAIVTGRCRDKESCTMQQAMIWTSWDQQKIKVLK
ncbi:hypothetical protein RYX36_031591, partial [Vicia faba]